MNLELWSLRKKRSEINFKLCQVEFFQKYKFNTHILLNLNSIYDSDGVLCAILIKEQLYEL